MPWVQIYNDISNYLTVTYKYTQIGIQNKLEECLNMI